MICDTLNIKPGALTIIGSGGKTSLLLTLANELSCKGRVIVMTLFVTWRPEFRLPVRRDSSPS